MEILPAIDILDGHAVRLLRGDYDAVTAYDERPEAVAAAWEAGGATMVHVVDLEAARGGRPQEAAIRAVLDVGTEVQLGGGIRTPDDAARAIDAGVNRVVVGSALVAPDPGALEGFAHRGFESRVQCGSFAEVSPKPNSTDSAVGGRQLTNSLPRPIRRSVVYYNYF